MTVSVIKPGIRGVNLNRSPFTLGTEFVRHAINMEFTAEGPRTRPGISFEATCVQGVFQGATVFRPGRGISSNQFGSDVALLMMSVDGAVWATATDGQGVHTKSVSLCEPSCTGDADLGVVDLFTAENYLVVQGTGRQTAWWDGTTADLTISPGMEELTKSVINDEETSSHDTFLWDKHKNFLVNGATRGLYGHSRIHQVQGRFIYISDPLHKRGYLKSDDILLMEEQRLPSFGPPLNVSTSLGEVRAMEITPRTGNAASVYGQGELVIYCEGGVVSANTHHPARRRKVSAKGEIVTEGWEGKRMVDPVCNVITAVGRYAVTPLPRNQLFRSRFGLHILSEVMGVEVLNDEPTHTFSKAVDPLLRLDRDDLLSGAATGYWIEGGRFLATTIMKESDCQSITPVAEGFVVFHKTFDTTLDGTPLPAWDGLWKPAPDTVTAIHRFIGLGVTPDSPGYGLLGSSDDGTIYYGAFSTDLRNDFFDGKEVVIPWSLETGRVRTGDYAAATISDAVIETTLLDKKSSFTIEVRTDRQQSWTPWFDVTFESAQVHVEDVEDDVGLFVGLPVGTPPEDYQTGGWFQFRFRGLGPVQIHAFSVEMSAGQAKCSGTVQSQVPLTDPISLTP